MTPKSLVDAFEKAFGKSKGIPFKMRKCKDVENFLKMMRKWQKKSKKAKMEFKESPNE